MFMEDIRECVERMDMMLDSQIHTRMYLIQKEQPG